MSYQEISLGDALKKYFEHSSLKPGMLDARLREDWEKLMGKTIAKYTDSIELKNKRLIIYTTVSTLKHELSFSKDKIIRLVNGALGEEIVEEIVIR
jgi:hypothetical protein